jgi:hypothetical protein
VRARWDELGRVQVVWAHVPFSHFLSLFSFFSWFLFLTFFWNSSSNPNLIGDSFLNLSLIPRP